MNILTDRLPESITVCRTHYPIHTDFRVWIKAAILLESNQKNGLELLAELFSLCIKPCQNKTLPQLEQLTEAILNFYLCGKKLEKSTLKSNKKNVSIFSYEYDANYIYAAFYSQYGIDLTSVNMHWWKFKALFDGLCGEHKFCNIVGYRSADISKIKDKVQRAHIRKMQNFYRLPDNRTQAEKDADIANAFL